MSELDNDYRRQISGNEAGKEYKPKRFGPRPIPSAQFSYDFNNCRSWFDRWKARGGSIARDCVYLTIANDLQDLRTFDERVTWARLEQRLDYRRGQLRRGAMAKEIRKERCKVIPLIKH